MSDQDDVNCPDIALKRKRPFVELFNDLPPAIRGELERDYAAGPPLLGAATARGALAAIDGLGRAGGPIGDAEADDCHRLIEAFEWQIGRMAPRSRRVRRALEGEGRADG